MEQTTIVIDGIGLNASYFVPLGKEKAVAEMKADKILETHGKDEKWAATAYDGLVTGLKVAEEKAAKAAKAVKKN